MNSHVDKIHVNKSQLVSNGETQLKRIGQSTFHFLENRPEYVAQRKLQDIVNNSPQVSQLRAFQAMANNSFQVKRMAQLQAVANNNSAQQQQPIQRKENNTGLPDALKSGMESISGLSLSDVKVHRNSEKPAQLQAYAYAQGSNIHLGPGQEKHLPHELGHVVQQKQGRVKPTMQLKGKFNINDDPGLEKDADFMGNKALGINQLTIFTKELKKTASSSNSIQGMFSVDSNVFQFGGEGASKWIPAVVALGVGLLLVYNASGRKEGEISAEEAQKRKFVSSDDVERDAMSLNALPSAEGISGPVEPQGRSLPLGTNDITVSAGKPFSVKKSNEKKESKKNPLDRIEFGEGPDFLKPVEALEQVSSGSITEDYTGPKASKDENSIKTNLLKAELKIRTPGSSTETQATLGKASIERGDDSIDMNVGLGSASVDYRGQHTRGKASVEGPNVGMHFGKDGANINGSVGNASAEAAASIKGKKWAATVGGKAQAEFPNFKVAPDGVEMNGMSTSASVGIGVSRENPSGEHIQMFWIKREIGELPTAGVNLDEIVRIVKEEPEVLEKGLEKFSEAMKSTMADELGVDSSFFDSVQVVEKDDLKTTSIFEKFAAFFRGSSSSEASDESSSEVERRSSSFSDDSQESIADSTEKAKDVTPISEERINEIVAEAIPEATDEMREFFLNFPE